MLQKHRFGTSNKTSVRQHYEKIRINSTYAFSYPNAFSVELNDWGERCIFYFLCYTYESKNNLNVSSVCVCVCTEAVFIWMNHVARWKKKRYLKTNAFRFVLKGFEVSRRDTMEAIDLMKVLCRVINEMCIVLALDEMLDVFKCISCLLYGNKVIAYAEWHCRNAIRQFCRRFNFILSAFVLSDNIFHKNHKTHPN